MVLEQLINGLSAGAEYALIAAGLALLFGVLEIVNFAHGELYMVGAYILYFALTALGLTYGLAVPVAILGMVAFGVLFYYAVVRRILHRGWQVQLVATLAASTLLVNLAIVVEGSLPKTVPSGLANDIVTIGPVSTSVQRLLVIVAALVTFALLALFLARTRTGRAMRAVAQNRQAAAVVGISVERIGLFAVIIACALAGVAAATVAPLYNVSPTMGALPVIKGFAAVIMGGFGNVTGAIVAAFLLGITEAYATAYISSDYADAIVFGVMILVLLFKPHGIVGRAVRA